ncbi:MAG: ferrous iron transport protein B [Propionibacteriaceae bacterium]|jgi:ferrous iron transport protein B|nr:ferrous iron transport protein B [Propionibacteriaceae bacterium]
MSPALMDKPCCHSPNIVANPDDPVIAIAGAPNVGKSTLFNALTGAGASTGNWPGTSTEYSHGVWKARSDRANGEVPLTVIDLPGSYSLDPMSPDEQLTADLLMGEDRPDATVVIVDAAHLARSLYLVAQLREHPMKLVVAVTMSDIAGNRGVVIDSASLQRSLGVPVVVVDPRRRTGIEALAQAVRETIAGHTPRARAVVSVKGMSRDQCNLTLEDDRFAYLEEAAALATSNTDELRADMGDRIDRWATAPLTGPLIFLALMWGIFEATTTLAAPLQDWLDVLFSDTIAGWLESGFEAVGWGDSWVSSLVLDGLVTGVGAVLTFAPLMAIMFVLLAILEDSGYLARAAVVTDRMMRRLGLPGQAFLPLVVGFGCNVPGISATRILPLPRQRLLTALLVPFTSCTARLTVYLCVAEVFFPQWAGTVVFAMYLLSILLVVGTGLILRATLWRTMPDPPLVLDLPPYQIPTLALTASVAWRRLKGFLQTASGIIVAVVVVVWLLQSIPAVGSEGSFADVDVADSLYASIARWIAPVFAPAGFGQWELASTLIIGFVAKEAVISSWAQTFNVPDPEAGGGIAGLSDALHRVFQEASGGYMLPAVIAFLVFLLAYTPCVATLAAQKREIGLKWTLIGVVLQLAIAWILAVIVFQIGCLLL